MSTKATVAYGKNFHLYKECLDEDFIYLEIEGVQFEASYGRVMMPIPIHIWEVIRQYEGVDLSWADATEEEIVRYVEQRVDERIQEYQQAENDKNKRLITLAGSIPYGMADTPRGQQIERGIGYFQNLKEHQLQVKSAITALKQENQDPSTKQL